MGNTERKKKGRKVTAFIKERREAGPALAVRVF